VTAALIRAYALPCADQCGSSGVAVCGVSISKNSMPVTHRLFLKISPRSRSTRDGLKIRTITYAKVTQAIDFSNYDTSLRFRA
jgi:hypothetical protein